MRRKRTVQPFGSCLGWLGRHRHLQLFRKLLILAIVTGKVQRSIQHTNLSPNTRNISISRGVGEG